MTTNVNSCCIWWGTGAIRFGSFRLKSGRLSPYFINIADAMRTGSDAVKVVNAYVARIKELELLHNRKKGKVYVD